MAKASKKISIDEAMLHDMVAWVHDGMETAEQGRYHIGFLDRLMSVEGYVVPADLLEKTVRRYAMGWERNLQLLELVVSKVALRSDATKILRQAIGQTSQSEDRAIIDQVRDVLETAKDSLSGAKPKRPSARASETQRPSA